MKANINNIADYFKVFSLYLNMDYEDCRERMKVYFRNLPNSGVAKNSNTKIDRWWNGQQNPQVSGKSRQKTRIKLFYRQLAQAQGKQWKSSWLKLSLDELEKDELLRISVRRYKMPYAVARFNKDYAENYGHDLMRATIRKYCHRYFFIYRLHSLKAELVRDVLRFRNHYKENIFCNLYQYSDHEINDSKNPNWTNIKRFNGNALQNASCLNLLFGSPNFSREHGAEYVQMIVPRFHENTEKKGLMMALEDETHNPAAAPILIVRTDKEIITKDEMIEYVSPIDIAGEKEQAIYDYLAGDLGDNMLLIK